MNADLIAKLRADTPGCSSLLHFNNAGCALTPEPVFVALNDYLALEQQLGGYEAAEQQATAIQNFYAAMARLLNCHSDEIAWMESATRAWATAITSIGLRPGDKVITGQSEYASNLLALLQLQRMLGIEVCVIPNDSRGVVDLDRMEAAIDKKVRLIALTHVPSQFGVTQPAAEAGRIAAAHGLLFLLDACQSAGQMALDVELLGCHMLTGSGRKFLRGPRGSGFLYVRRNVIDRLQPLTVDLSAADWLSDNQYRLKDDARRFESWECFVAGKIALGVAADYAASLGLESIASRIGLLTQKLDQGLRELPGYIVHEPPGSHPGIITFSSRHESADELRRRLRTASVNIGVARLASNRLDFKKRNLPDVCRISPHYYNTEGEIERVLGLLGDRFDDQNNSPPRG